MVKVSVEVPPARIGDGEKSLEIDGGRMAVSVAVPRLFVFVPLSVVETKPLTLECTPGVVAVTCTLKPLPEARSTGSHLSSWLPTAPVIAQLGVTSPVGPESIDQETPAPEPAGSGLSSRTTFFAVPGPALETVIVKPMSSPASTVS